LVSGHSELKTGPSWVGPDFVASRSRAHPNWRSPIPWPEPHGATDTLLKRAEHWWRSGVFDAPNGDFSCARRTRSNTPLAALTSLNETVFVEAAQALALRVLKEGGSTDADRVRQAYRLYKDAAPKVLTSLATITYVLESDDYLTSLANRYNTTVGAIMGLNNLISPKQIQAGQELIIPGTQP
jgi:hypothetical protein